MQKMLLHTKSSCKAHAHKYAFLGIDVVGDQDMIAVADDFWAVALWIVDVCSSSSLIHNCLFWGSTDHCRRLFEHSNHHWNCWYDSDWRRLNLVEDFPAKQSKWCLDFGMFFKKFWNQVLPLHAVRGEYFDKKKWLTRRKKERESNGSWQKIKRD